MEKRYVELLKYVKKNLKRGAKKERIIAVLANAGWKEEEINNIFAEIEKPKVNIFTRRVKETAPIPIDATEDIPLEEKKPKSLTEKIDEIDEKLEQITTRKKKVKPDKSFELPFWQQTQTGSLAKKGKLLVIYPQSNRNITTMITKVDNELAMIDGKPRKISLDHVFLWRGKFPCIILPEWDLEPIGTKDYYDATFEGRKSSAAATIIKMIFSKEQLNKMTISPKIMLIVGILVVAVLYMLFAGGK